MLERQPDVFDYIEEVRAGASFYLQVNEQLFYSSV